MKMQHWRAGLASMLVAVPACSTDSTGGGACTAMFAIVPVVIVDTAGLPVEGAAVSAVLVRTGQTLVATNLALFAPGTYPLVDDGSTSLIRRSGDEVQASITKGGQSMTVDYVFSVPDGCHISKVSGPSTVVFQ